MAVLFLKLTLWCSSCMNYSNILNRLRNSSWVFENVKAEPHFESPAWFGRKCLLLFFRIVDQINILP